MTSETPGWYHAELDPADTKRYWNGSEWSREIMGGATLWPRFGARMIDAVITGIVLFVIWWAAFDASNANTYGITIVSFFLVALYEIGFVTLRGATPGKMFFRFKVVQIADGQSPPPGSVAAMRYAPSLLSVIPFLGSLLYLIVLGLSLYWLQSDPDRQSIFDRAGKTFVVRTV
ncbi:MAG: RDD family protein [Actinomycetota bacterium]